MAIPVADIAAVYGNLENTLHLEISVEQKSNADSIYSLVRYGIAGGSEGWIPGVDVPFIGADGFCSPIGSGWERLVTSEFGNRIDPITGKRKGHGGMDLAVPTGTPIRAARCRGTVTVSSTTPEATATTYDRPRQRTRYAVRSLLSASGESGTNRAGGRYHRPLRQHRAFQPGRTSTSRCASTGSERIPRERICRKAERKEMIMNITATQITPERERELVEKLVDLLSSRYDAGNLYDILRHGLGMDHSDMEALGFQLRDYYEEVE